jgi:hypothetical protein
MTSSIITNEKMPDELHGGLADEVQNFSRKKRLISFPFTFRYVKVPP